MTRRAVYWAYMLSVVVVGLIVGLVTYVSVSTECLCEDYTLVKRAPRISPDYADTVIPPNIAPLNFVVKEPGSEYCVRISSARGRRINVFSSSGHVVIPVGPWQELLSANRGEKLTFDVYVMDSEDRWNRFAPVTNTIAKEDIDGYLVYRQMPVYNLVWSDMGIYQRNLQNHDERVILHNKSITRGCCNCHTFLNGHCQKRRRHEAGEYKDGVQSHTGDLSVMAPEWKSHRFFQQQDIAVFPYHRSQPGLVRHLLGPRHLRDRGEHDNDDT